MWLNSPLQDLYHSLPCPNDSGWIRQPNGSFSIDWEAPEVQDQIKTNIDFLIKGCSCKKGCKTKSCGCRKKSNYCGPGCECQGCTNLQVQQDGAEDDSSSTDDETPSDLVTASSDSSDSSDDDLDTEVITDEFPFTAHDIL